MNLGVPSPTTAKFPQASCARPYLKSKSACCHEEESTSSTTPDNGRLQLPSRSSKELLEIGSNSEVEESLSHDGKVISVAKEDNKKINQIETKVIPVLSLVGAYSVN